MLATFVCKIKLSASYWFLDGIIAVAVVGSAEYEKHTHNHLTAVCPGQPG